MQTACGSYSASKQVVALVHTYGTTYSSTGVVFGGGAAPGRTGAGGGNTGDKK